MVGLTAATIKVPGDKTVDLLTNLGLRITGFQWLLLGLVNADSHCDLRAKSTKSPWISLTQNSHMHASVDKYGNAYVSLDGLHFFYL